MLYALIIILILIIVFLLESIREQHIVKVTSYDIEIPPDKEVTEDKCFVFLSDYHEAKSLNLKIVSKIRDISPDAVLIGGDMLNGKNPKERVSDAAGLINSIVEYYPVYFAFGNHEKKVKEDYYDTYNLWESFTKNLSPKVKFLVDQHIEPCDNVVIYGLDIPMEYYSRIKYPKLSEECIAEKLGVPDKAKYNILLGHTPDFINGYKNWGADLVLSGHFHGGMVRLPILGGVISPRLKLFPKYDYGKYEEDSTTMIVTNGLGCHSIKFRFYNVPEIVQINIKVKVKAKGK